MDFNDSPDEATFRAEARAWLEKTIGAPAAKTLVRIGDPESMKIAKAYQKKKAEAGYAGLTWKKESAAANSRPSSPSSSGRKNRKFQAPVGLFAIGLGMCIPTVIAFHSPDKIKRYVGPALRGDEIWCQLFSEPAAPAPTSPAQDARGARWR